LAACCCAMVDVTTPLVDAGREQGRRRQWQVLLLGWVHPASLLTLPVCARFSALCAGEDGHVAFEEYVEFCVQAEEGWGKASPTWHFPHSI
jgi:hypothetical protein